MKSILAIALMLALSTACAWAQPVLDPTTCGVGAALAPGSKPVAGQFTNDALTSDSSQTCRITIAGTTPRRCSAMRLSGGGAPDPVAVPIGCQVIINATNTTLLIAYTGPSGAASYDVTISYESSTY